MPLLNTANNVYLGSSQVDKVYLGSNLIWPSGVSGPESLFQPGTVPSSVESSDPGAVTLGLIFDSLVAGTVTAIHVYLPPGPRFATVQVGLFDTFNAYGGNLLGSSGAVAVSGLTAGAWNRIALTTPVAIDANAPYVACWHKPTSSGSGGDYALTSGFHDSLRTNGDLRALANSDGTYYDNIGNGRFKYGASLDFPTGTFGASWYGVDVEFTAS